MVLAKNERGILSGQPITQLLQRRMSFSLTIYSKYLNCDSKNNWGDFLFNSRTEHLTLISTQEQNLFLLLCFCFPHCSFSMNLGGLIDCIESSIEIGY